MAFPTNHKNYLQKMGGNNRAVQILCVHPALQILFSNVHNNLSTFLLSAQENNLRRASSYHKPILKQDSHPSTPNQPAKGYHRLRKQWQNKAMLYGSLY